MKRTILLTALILMSASFGSLNAQSLLDLLGGRGSSKSSAAGKAPVEKINIDALKGKWKYSGAAVEFTGNDLVAALGSSVAAPSIKQSLESYFARMGIVPGSAAIEFKEKDIYTAATSKHSIEGPYSFDAQTQKVRVTYDHPELGGHNSIDGRVTFAGEKLMLTFESEKILEIIKELTAGQTLDQNIRDLLEMISEYKGLYLGFEMEK